MIGRISPYGPALKDKRMTKQDIVDKVVDRTGLSKTNAEIAVEAVFETMKRSMERGERIELRGFGVFNIRPRKTGIGRNPRTGQEVIIPPAKAVRFKPGKNLQSIYSAPNESAEALLDPVVSKNSIGPRVVL